MFESPNTQPRMVQEHHRRQRAGSSKTMFESPNTQPHKLREHHLRVQERPATIAPKASAQRLISPKKKKLHIKPPSGEFESFKKMTITGTCNSLE